MAQTYVFTNGGLFSVVVFFLWLMYLMGIEAEDGYDPQEPPFFFPSEFQILFLGVFVVAFSMIPGGQ